MVQHGDVVFTSPWRFQTCFVECRDDPVSVPHASVFNTRTQIIGDQLSRIRLNRESLAQLGGINKSLVSRLKNSGPQGIVGASPALGMVPRVAQSVEVFLPAGRRYVQRFTRAQVHASAENMHMYAATLIPVQDSTPGIPIRLQPRPRQFFKIIQDHLDLLFTWSILGRPGNHSTAIAVNKMERICHCGHGMRIAAQHPDLGSLQAVVVLLLQQILRGFLPTARAVL